MDSIAGRRILVTGADSGIGLAFVEATSAAGAELAAIVRDDDGRLDGLVDRSHRFVADLGDAEMAARASEQAIDALGALDALVYSAGLFVHEGLVETSADTLDNTLAVNLRAAFIVAQAAARRMMQTGRGSIVLVSSQIGEVGHPRAAAYAASKAGMNGLVRAAAVELAPHGIRVNAVAPGPTATPMTAEAMADPERSAKLVEQIPLGRLAEPGDIAAAILFLLSDGAASTTGHILTVDGGFTAQ